MTKASTTLELSSRRVLVEITQSAADPIRRSRRLGRNAVPFSPYRQRKGLGYDKQRRSNQVARVNREIEQQIAQLVLAERETLHGGEQYERQPND
jgi:hypothetical protein